MQPDHATLVEQLGIPHRADAARRALMRAGSECTEALRKGLHHPDPAVRIGCCMVLDHFLDPEAVPELMANLDHAHPGVRNWALHALACDRCKEGACRPGEDETIPLALDALEHDPDRYVRKSAVLLLGPAVHTRPDVLAVLERAHHEDPDPLVRKCASWYVPGGPIYERTKPKPTRKSKARVSIDRRDTIRERG